MQESVSELRHGERFVVLGSIQGTFGPADLRLLNLSLNGAQIVHPQPLRIGSKGRIQFRLDDVSAAISAAVIWSRLSKQSDSSGKLLYESGLRIEQADEHWAAAIHGLLRRGAIRQDVESLDRKRRRAEERERQRAAVKTFIIPLSGPKPES